MINFNIEHIKNVAGYSLTHGLVLKNQTSLFIGYGGYWAGDNIRFIFHQNLQTKEITVSRRWEHFLTGTPVATTLRSIYFGTDNLKEIRARIKRGDIKELTQEEFDSVFITV